MKFCFSMSKIPSDGVLESLYKLRIRESAQLKPVLEIARHGDSSEDIDCPTIKKLKTMVKRILDQKFTITKRLTPGTGKIETGAVIKNRKGLRGVWRKRYFLPVERKKAQCFARRPMQFPSRDPRSCTKNQKHTAATPSEPSMTRGRSESRKRSVRGQKVRLAEFFDKPCRYYLKGTCHEIAL